MHARLNDAASVDEVGQALINVAGRFGFSTSIIVDMTESFEHVGRALIFAAMGRGPVVETDARKPFGRNPLFVRARETDEPFVMSRVRTDAGISEEEWWSFFPCYFRGYDGLVVPVHNKSGLVWYVGLAGAEPNLSPRVRAVLAAAAYATHERFEELRDAKPTTPLTQREVECLKLVTQGKSDAEIGRQLNISARTVRFHIGNAKTKLGVATRIQAVAKRLGGP